MRLKRRTLGALLGALIFFSLFLATSGSVFATTFYTTNSSTEIGTAYENAIELSVKAYPGGAPAAVVTNGEDWTQSAGASVLARAYGGPLILSNPGSLTTGVSSEVKRLKPAVVFAVGLTESTAASLDAALAGLSPRPWVVRLSGANAYETCAAVARHVKSKLGVASKVVVVPSDYSGGVLAGSAMAAANGWPILLTPAAGPFPQVSANAIRDIGATSGIVVGTTLKPAVSGFGVETNIMGTVAGDDPDGRFSLCANTAEYARARGYSSYSRLGMTEAYDRVGGIVVSAYVARDRGVLVLAASASIPWPTTDFMREHGREVSEVSIVGLSWGHVREVKSKNAARVDSVSPGSGWVTGGTKVVVKGSGLDSASSVIIGKQVVPAADWRIDSSSQLTILATPKAYGVGPTEVIVQNYWNRSPATVSDLYRYVDGTPPLPGETVVNEAIKQLGVRYVWAGSTPSGGFDCSGLTMYAYKQLGIYLPHYSRAQAGYGTPVGSDQLMPGDLVFFSDPISHVGIYVGGGLMVNAPRSGDLVTIENVYRSTYNTARRIISPYTYFSDGDSRLSFTGSWGAETSSAAADGSFRYLNSPGMITVKFNGTYLKWLATTGPRYGKAKVTVDGATSATVDLYSSTSEYQKAVWTTGTLNPGVHTITIEWTGTKNAAASSYRVDVDAFDLLGALVQAPNPVRYQESDPRLSYQGTWAKWYTPSVSNGVFNYSSSAGKATVTFDGTYFAWVAQTGPIYGKAGVALDGGTPKTVDLYAAAYGSQQTVYCTPPLAEGPHTVTIEWTGTKNPAATNDLVNVDAIDVVGDLTDATLLPPGAVITRFQQNDGRLAYSGTWARWYARTASGGSFDYADAPARVNIEFDGRYLAWLADMGPVYGKASVILDKGTPQTVDLYASTYRGKQVAYRTGVLQEGHHTLTIEWTGDKNAAASNDTVNVDALDLVGALTQASGGSTGAVTRHEETDPLLGYMGYWTPVGVAGASGGASTYVGAAAKLVLGFKGTSLNWVAEKSKYYGIAKVTLDDRPSVQVDLYSAATLYQQTVYSTGELGDGTHTLTIEWTGSKNPSALANCIGVDAFDVAGELVQAPGLTRLQQDAGQIAYAGSWAPNPWGVPASGGSSYVTNTFGSSATVRFNGTYIGWVTKKSPYYGRAKVFLDQKAPVTVDLYDSNEVWQQRVWNSGFLPPGEHTLTIQWSFGRNKSALDTNLSVDAFDIAGSIEQAVPTVKHDTSTVVIDPGHQAYANSGLEPVGPGSSTMKAKVSAGTASVNTGAPESALNLALGLKLKTVLQGYGVSVVMTRETEAVDISNAQRAQLANQAGGDVFVRIHADGSTDPSVHGILVLYPATIAGWTDDIASESLRGASLALEELIKATGAKNRGLGARSDLAGFNWSNVPVFLAELGLMTNPAEDALLATDSYRNKLVSGLAKSILCFLDYY